MLGNVKTATSFSCKSILEVREFYVDKLGMVVDHENDYMISFKTGGDTSFYVYSKQDHIPAVYTVLNFLVDDVKSAVMYLNEKGIAMEQYPDMGTDEMGIAKDEAGEIAWFKDPARNILSLIRY